MHRYGLSWLRPRSIALAAFAVAASTEAAQYEGAPTFSAAQALQGVPLRGPDYSIGSSVPVENFQYVFNVNTKWGPFRVKGSDLLRVRLREIGATAKLEEVNGAETAVESAGKTALRPLNTAKDLVTDPAQTIGDTFRGVGHIFGSADATMNATDPHGDSMIASVTGGASARRKQAFNLGVDPNTTFPPLADRVEARRDRERLRRDLGQCRHEFRRGARGLCHRRDRHRGPGPRDAPRQDAGRP